MVSSWQEMENQIQLRHRDRAHKLLGIRKERETRPPQSISPQVLKQLGCWHLLPQGKLSLQLPIEMME